MTAMNVGPTRTRFSTVSGSLYAIWHHPDWGWWIRSKSVPAVNGWTLADAWRRIHPLDDWPPVVGRRIPLEFIEPGLVEVGENPRLTFLLEDEWRTTTAIQTVGTWSPEDAWPGDPPVAEERFPTSSS